MGKQDAECLPGRSKDVVMPQAPRVDGSDPKHPQAWIPKHGSPSMDQIPSPSMDQMHLCCPTPVLLRATSFSEVC